jgi:hypothetical protein
VNRERALILLGVVAYLILTAVLIYAVMGDPFTMCSATTPC